MDKQREEFERKCGVYDGTEFSETEGKYIPSYHGEVAYRNTNSQNALLSGWKAAQAALQPEIDRLNKANEQLLTLSGVRQYQQEADSIVEAISRENNQLRALIKEHSEPVGHVAEDGYFVRERKWKEGEDIAYKNLYTHPIQEK